MAEIYVSDSTTSTGITLQDGDLMHVESGGIANKTTVNRGGRMYISAGGLASDTTASDEDVGGEIHDKNSGSVSYTMLTAGAVSAGKDVTGVKFTVGNYGDVDLAGVTLSEGNDTLTFGQGGLWKSGAVTVGGGNDKVTLSGAKFFATGFDLGAGNDTLTFGNGISAEIDLLDFGGGKDSLKIGNDCELRLNAGSVDSLDKMTIGKNSTLYCSEALRDYIADHFSDAYLAKNNITVKEFQTSLAMAK